MKKSTWFPITLVLSILLLWGAIFSVNAEESVIRLEAEKAEKTGNVITALQQGTVGKSMNGEGDSLIFTLEVPEDGFYTLTVHGFSAGGAYKENYVKVDGQNVGMLVMEWPIYHDVEVPRFYMEKGTRKLSIEAYWGYITVDYILITPAEDLAEDIYQVERTLTNPNASENTRRLMNYLCDIYGEKVLSGQYCDRGMTGMEMKAINKATGHYPAVLGMDMMDYSPTRVARGAKSVTIDKAIEYWEKKGGIITLAWHWGADSQYILDGYDENGNPRWWGNFYTKNVTFDLEKALNGEDPAGYQMLLDGIDAIAAEFKKLAEKDIPILWRPLHEASGGWFWWGAKGPEACKELWILMYDRMTNYHGLNNLIWVWNGQDAAWYPGDAYVDIIGEDIYPDPPVHTSESDRFIKASKYTDTRKLIVLSENGSMPDPDLMLRDGTLWGFFATWSGDFIIHSGTKLSNNYTNEDVLNRIYNSDLVITRDEMPDIRTYPLPE